MAQEPSMCLNITNNEGEGDSSIRSPGRTTMKVMPICILMTYSVCYRQDNSGFENFMEH